MLFRNPFQFGKPLPWKLAGDVRPNWKIVKKMNIFNLSRFIVSPIKSVKPYNDNCSGNSLTESDEGLVNLKATWETILGTIRQSSSQSFLGVHGLTAAVPSVLNEKSDLKSLKCLVERFVPYLKKALGEETSTSYVPTELSEAAEDGEGRLLGKSVRDFSYPQSGFFITEDKYMGCSISSTKPNDVVFIARGSTYDLVLRPDGEDYRSRGFGYVHGSINAKQKATEIEVVRIR
jgi:hypothetical protein